MRIGLQVPRFTWPDAPGSIGPKLAEIGKAADEAGFASIWVMDHFFQIGVVGEPEEPMLEGYSALNYLASITQRVKQGALPCVLVALGASVRRQFRFSRQFLMHAVE